VKRVHLLPGISTTVAVVFLSGCYPAYLTSRPEAEIIVTDESGAPLDGATVTLGTMEWHGIVGRNTLADFLTDREGRVEFDRQHDWAVQVLLPDGDKRYSWSLCFSKPGFEAVPLVHMKFDAPIEVEMYPSAEPSECQWQQHEGMPRVEEREARWIEVEGGSWQSNSGITRIMDETIRGAMETSAREQGIELRPWSEYRFQHQTRGTGIRDARILVHAICRVPMAFNLNEAFYSEPDDGACFFDTTYTNQTYTDQPKSGFGPLQIVASGG
jgi:hypothetical protein